MPTYDNLDLGDSAIWNNWDSILNNFLNGTGNVLGSGWFMGALMVFGSLAVVLFLWKLLDSASAGV